MRVLWLLFALLCSVYGANLLSMSVNENSDFVEINLAFDGSFDGAIEQNATNQGPLLKISGISVDSKKDVALSQNPLISRAVLSKDGTNGVTLAFTTKQDIGFEALKNNDGYKLQLKILPKSALDGAATDNNATSDVNKTPASPHTQQTAVAPKPDDDSIGWRYVAMVSFLLCLVALMFYIKKRYATRAPSAPKSKSSGWLLPKKFAAAMRKEPALETEKEVRILTQSFLDPNNKLMLVEYNDIKYLLLVGNTNVVIDRYFADDVSASEDDFKRIMNENEHKLAEFLQPRQQLSTFDTYKMKAEGDI